MQPDAVDLLNMMHDTICCYELYSVHALYAHVLIWVILGDGVFLLLPMPSPSLELALTCRDFKISLDLAYLSWESALQQRVWGIREEYAAHEQHERGYKGKAQGEAESPGQVDPGHVDDQIDDLCHQDEEGQGQLEQLVEQATPLGSCTKSCDQPQYE